MTEAFHALFATFLGIWFVLSLMTAARCRWVAGRKRWDVFQMLSGWRLFVAGGDGRPAAYPVLYRDRLRDGATAPLQLAFKGTVVLGPSTRFWSTARDEQILVRRLAKDLLKQQRGQHGTGGAAGTRGSYHHLAHIIRRCPASPDAEARQFVILATTGEPGGRPPTEVYRSGFLPL